MSKACLAFFGIVSIGLCAFLPEAAHAGYQQLPMLRVFERHEQGVAMQREWRVVPWKKLGGVNVVVEDLGTDGTAEILTAGSLGMEPRIHLYRADGSEIASFVAYDPAFGRGVNVATGDLDGDGTVEIVTAPEYRAGPHVRIFDVQGNERFVAGGFFAYNELFRGGMDVAAADVDGDGRDEIVTAAGKGGGPHVRVFDSHGSLEYEFFAFAHDMTRGLSVDAGDIDGDGTAEIMVARAGGGDPVIRVFSLDGTSGSPAASGQARLLFEFAPFDQSYQGGVEVQVADMHMDDRADIIATPNGEAGAHVRVFTGWGEPITDFFAYEGSEDLGLRADAGDIDGDGSVEFVTAPHHALTSPGDRLDQDWIEIDLARQQLYAWETGRLANTFLVSTGLARYPTPVGEFSVFRKLPVHRYSWSYGEGHPDNYDIPGVKWNVNFARHIYIHHAFWHNNFGYQMSHGCVNAPWDASKWTYEWSRIGMPVVTHW